MSKSKAISLICLLLGAALLFVSCAQSGGEETTGEATVTDGETKDAVTRSEKIEDGKLNIVIGGGTEAVCAKPGEEVELKIELVNNTGISSLRISLSLDPKLSPVLEKNSDGENEAKAVFNIADSSDDSVMKITKYNKDKNVLILNWLTAMKEVKGDTVYATISFKVSDDASEGDFLPITAEINPNDVFDYDQNNVDYNLINGGITVAAK